MKEIELGERKIFVAEHKGDVLYERFVMFKQYAPQFFEKMDSPLFEVYLERIDKAYNEGNFMKARVEIENYKFAISQKGNNDAWGMCFALISYENEPNIKDEKYDDATLKAKLKRMNDAGLTPEIVEREVVNFMKTSPETFMAHLALWGMLKKEDK